MIVTKLEVITPEMAIKYLATNAKHQRPVSPSRVNRYVQLMLKGQWIFDGDPIRFDTEGNLINGQARLRAVVKSGCPQQFLVIRGLESRSFYTMDSGKSRSASDMLYSVGARKGVTEIASAIRMILINDACGRVTSFEFLPFEKKNQFRDSGLFVDFYLEHRAEFDYAVQLGTRFQWIYRTLYGSVLLTGIFLFSRVDSERTEEFLQAVFDDSDEDGTPTHAFRLFLLRIANSGSGQNFSHGARICAMIKCWNAFYQGKRLNRVVLSSLSAGIAVEGYPYKNIE